MRHTVPRGTASLISGALMATTLVARTAAAQSTATAEEVTLATATGAIHGTLEMPAPRGAAASAVPLVVIIAGSGPTDRNGNSTMLPGANNSLAMLAAGLASHGIASVRYDKRGIGASRAAMTSEAALRFDDYANDAAGWVKHFRDDPRFSTITLAGHSEGSLLGMIAAQRSPADGYVSISGVARPANQILHDQLAPKLPPALLQQADAMLAALVAGHTVEVVPPPLASLFRPSVQPYLISWFAHDPSAEIARLNAPVLIVQGTTDIQVPPSEAQLLAKAKPSATLVIVEGMNHVLKMVPADPTAQLKSYSEPALPVSPTLIDRIAAFVERVRRR